MKKIVVLSGAGISAESGLATFRGEGGMWNGMDVLKVATAEAWKERPTAVLEFYNRRRDALRDARPNEAHRLVAELERWHDVTVVTQNVDDLHERAGSTDVIHLHGELTWARPEDTYTVDDGFSEADLEWVGYDPIRPGDTGGENREQMRPHVVLFGEPAPKVGAAALRIRGADCLLIVGTSLQVEPAACLYEEAPPGCRIVVVDPQPSPIDGDLCVTHIFKKATEGIRDFYRELGHDVTTVTVRRWSGLVDGGVDEHTAQPRESYYVLDGEGRCLSVMDGSVRKRFLYDGAGNMVREETKESGRMSARSYEYDDAGCTVAELEESGPWNSVLAYRWSHDRRSVDIRGEDRVRKYFRPDGRLKHVIWGWYGPRADETFYKRYRSGELKSIKLKRFADEVRELAWLSFLPSGRCSRVFLQAANLRIDYSYQDDPHGNWIRQEGRTSDGKLVELVRRTIRYGDRGFSRTLEPACHDHENPLTMDEDAQINDWTK